MDKVSLRANALVLTAALMTSGCGGGGGGESSSVASTPTPAAVTSTSAGTSTATDTSSSSSSSTSTSSATSTSSGTSTSTGSTTASAASYDTLVGLSKNVSLVTSAVTATVAESAVLGQPSRTITNDTKPTYGSGQVVIAYDAASKTYTLRDGAQTISVGTAEKQSATSGPFDVYQRTDTQGNVVDYLQVYRAGNTQTSAVQLSYVTLVGGFHRTVGSSNGYYTASTHDVLAIGGNETLASDMPKTGTATYSTFVAAVSGDPNQVFGYSGSAIFSVDFAKSTVATSVTISDSTSNFSGTFAGAGTIAANSARFAGDMSVNGTKSGTFDGAFFGPQAAEVGYTFRVDTSLGTVAGAVVGRKN